MAFNSLHFLIFLPVVIILYFVLPKKAKPVFLLIASYYFYMCAKPYLIFIIVGVTLLSYFASLGIKKVDNLKIKKLILISSIILILGTLIFFKYFNFLIQSAIDFMNLFSLNIKSISLDIILPIGISFYTFQTISYIIDVYQEQYDPEKNIVYYALYVSFFPQLIAGPIEKANDLIPQLKEHHKFNREDFIAGMQLLAVGFFRKCVIADFCGIFVDSVFADLATANSLAIFVAGSLFLIQLYCDFCGYSEIAAGAARIMGIKLSKNFDRPFSSKNFTEFWSRWHITLSRWLNDYVYLPLSFKSMSSKHPTLRHIINTFVVFVLCGLWHGANWTFVLWGAYIGIVLAIESLIREPLKKLEKKCKAVPIIRRVLLFFIIIFASYLFRCQTIMEVGTAYSRLFTQFGFGIEYFQASLSMLNMKIIDIIELALIFVIMFKLYDFAYDLPSIEIQQEGEGNLRKVCGKSLGFTLLILCVALGWFMLISSDAASSFVYFQF